MLQSDSLNHLIYVREELTVLTRFKTHGRTTFTPNWQSSVLWRIAPLIKSDDEQKVKLLSHYDLIVTRIKTSLHSILLD